MAVKFLERLEKMVGNFEYLLFRRNPLSRDINCVNLKKEELMPMRQQNELITLIAREQAKRRKQADEQRKKVAQRKINTRRNIILGEILSDVLPRACQFQLQRTKAANDIEFAPIKNFLRKIMANEYLVVQAMKESGWEESATKHQIAPNPTSH